MNTVLTVIACIYGGAGVVGFLVVAEDKVKRHFGWGRYRNNAESRRRRAARLLSEAEALVADRAVLLRPFYD